MKFGGHFLLSFGAILALRKGQFLKDVSAKMAIFEKAQKNEKKCNYYFFCKNP